MLLNKGHKDGLEKAIRITNNELELAKSVNPQMAMGMSQVRALVSREIGR